MSNPSFFQNQEKEYHLLKIDNPLLNYYGLTAVTTGQLIEWWNRKNYKNNLYNRLLFSINDPNAIQIGDIFATSEMPYTFKTWRKEGYNGKYVTYDMYNIDQWKFYEDTNSIYSYNNLIWEGECDGSNVISPDASGQFGLMPWFYKIINSHNSVIKAYSKYGADSSSIYWTDCLKARKALSEDIIIAGGITWTTPITFNIDLQNIKCEKTEDVKFTLQLFNPEEPKKNIDNFAAFKKIFLSTTATDQAGRKIVNQLDGGYTAPTSENNPKDQKVGELSLTWDDVAKKFEAGTIQVPAILYTDIEAANPRDSEIFQSMDVSSELSDPNSPNYPNMPTGIAIPFYSTNGNPTTFVPQYEKEEGCRDGDLSKLQLVVSNPWPRNFKKDQNVILSKINGCWIPIDTGQGQAAKKKKQFQSKWDFAYFMTNPNHFYIRKDGSRFTYQDFESKVRELYYSNSNEILDLDIKTDIPFGVNYGHLQITSFDFMSKSMGGKSDFNNLGNTNIEFDSSLNPYPRGGSDLRIPASSTAPFFGCIFPDGYNDSKIVNYFYGKHNGASVINTNLINSEPNFGVLYINTISSGQKLFRNNTEDGGNNIDMFPIYSLDGTGEETEYLKDAYLKHFPADIALNASENGNNGNPLTIFNDSIFYKFSTIHDITKKAFVSGVNTAKSFYDFSPVKSNRIQFRPLKAETYAFGEINQNDAKNYMNAANTQYVRQNPGIFGAQGRQTQKKYKSVLCTNSADNPSDFLIQRFYASAPSLAAVLMGDPLYQQGDYKRDLFAIWSRDAANPNKGLSYNRWFNALLTPDSFGSNAFKKSSKPTVHPRYNNNNGDFDYNALVWTKDWLLNPTRGGGGLGVIGASYKIDAENYIILNTQSWLGQPSWKNMSLVGTNVALSVIGDLIFGNPGAGQGWVDTRFAQTWGKCENYYDLNTTGLFVRIFSAWPKEQTYFDPRYFAVFHFNPIDKTKLYEKNSVWYKAGVKQDSDPPPNEEPSYPDGWYRVDEIGTSVDVRVPTKRSVNPEGYSEELSPETPIYKNDLRNNKDWNVNPIRRGKLLPFETQIPTVSISQNLVTLVIPQYQESLINKKFTNYDCIIYNKGQGYYSSSSGDDYDTFTVVDGKDVVLKPILDANGSITGFTVLNQGKDLSSNFFANKDDKIVLDQNTANPAYQQLLRIKPLKLSTSSKGTGFVGYITKGIIRNYTITDSGPKEIPNGPFKLTPDPAPLENLDVTYEPERITKISVKTTLTDGTVVPYSDSDEYDLFFHFHNDISHTLTEAKWLGTITRWENVWENAVNLTLSSE
jgi:hypothetical protein